MRGFAWRIANDCWGVSVKTEQLISMLKNPDEYFFRQQRAGDKILNYGCGNRKRDYEIGVDVSADANADYVIGESDRLPFEDGAFDHAVSRYVLEHVKDIYHVMHEVARVLAPGGTYRFVVPHAFSKDAFDDPTHVRFFTLNTVNYFVGGANIHYSKCTFGKCSAYLRVSLAWPRLKIIRYPINVLLGLMGYMAPQFSENMLKLPFMTGAIYCELVKAS